jgi:hypothetical protein
MDFSFDCKELQHLGLSKMQSNLTDWPKRCSRPKIRSHPVAGVLNDDISDQRHAIQDFLCDIGMIHEVGEAS